MNQFIKWTPLLLEVDNLNIALFALFVIACFFILCLYAFYVFWLVPSRPAISPYTKQPLRFGEDVKLSSAETIMRFLHYEVGGYDNKVFAMKKSMVCRDTGRIFQDCVNAMGRAQVDWTFLQKRCPGTWVSWGSLTDEQKQDILDSQGQVDGFQTEKSCPHPSPRAVTEEYIYIKPGPLYVDLKTKVLLGWKCVPGTIFEVLVVQRPGDKQLIKDSLAIVKKKPTTILLKDS
ncbi:hypothetical protein [Estrella lausannensis]|uniref:Conserved putative secreted protein n=1 Tax=Estrella lausannensis TaxID=483423 RepID=A0A0H5DT19_9BACT|nr:hypothetical protein [Estrella lausannensis]CRX39498.1 Conserved putative secreted protein [Estrella lausannensis]